jgi:transcription termination/antitermination protein NusG
MHSKMNENAREGQALPSRPWYAVYTKHQHEKTACELLARKDFEVFLPLYQAKRHWKDRRKVVSLPVFPCYLFLRTNLVRKLEILQTPGVFWLVESGGRTCEVPNSEIEAVRRITQSSVTAEPHPYLKCGDHVRVRQGALAGIEGVLIRVRNRYRVVVSVNLLQKGIAVEVDFSMVERIGRGGETSSLHQRESGALLSACN